MKILAFAASNSRKSINKALVTCAIERLNEKHPKAECEIADLNDWEMPLYSIDRENDGGIPAHAHDFRAKIAAADALIISFAEHNGSYTAAYKNLFDWMSRIEGKVYDSKPILLLSASPGARGGQSVLDTAAGSMPFFGAEVVDAIPFPKLHEIFDFDSGKLREAKYDQKLAGGLDKLMAKIADT